MGKREVYFNIYYMKRLTTEDFIKKANKVHQKYDYSLVNYKNSNTKVTIICPEHGEFQQFPLNHLKSGCAACNGNKKLTIEDFTKKANLLHNNKFNYSLVKFKNNDSLIEIVCPSHGLFTQILNKHLKGYGCNKCNHDNRRTKIEDFIEKSNIIHNNKYDYSLVEYKTTNTKVRIICKEHGIFEKTPKVHLKGEGCKKCIYITKGEFIKKCNLIHNNKYNYQNILYINLGKKINIICPEHGEFQQRAADHLKGSGCQKCGDRFGIKENLWLDSLNVNQRQIRIGKYIVDGYDPETNTVYEFNGDFWHGNPKIYKNTDINIVNGKTFVELYEKTIIREKYLKNKGYKVISIWESDF